ncbi:MAG: threonine--tRNA ligase [Acidimicrobiia bacterium]|nr:threonine--tRNA ligase [Acidimicrobiia bacterium]
MSDSDRNDITITLPDGSTRAMPKGSTPGDVALAIGKRLGKDALAAKVDGEWVDLGRPLDADGQVEIVVPASPDGREVLRHSTAHLVAQAVTDLFPGARYAIGPAIDDGFYYDFELPDGGHFTDADLARIEARMREIIDEDQAFVRDEVGREGGLAAFEDQPYKREIIEKVDASEVGDGTVVSLYRNPRADGSAFVDLCRGPHVPSTKRLGAFKLTKVAGAYWRGDEHGPMLQRVYGTAWESSKALEEHLHRLEEAERRDHRRLGAELDLFSFPPEIGGGLPVFHPKGAMVRKLMEDYSRAEHEAGGYDFVWTPHIAKASLYETSGHLEWYSEGMYPPMEMEGATYYPKPMNCPGHMLIYKSRQRSYRDLPLRLFEFGTVYRFERSGVIHGLTRVRGITQDDSHIFCTPDQLGDELASLLAFVLRLLRTFGLDEFEAELATRPEKFVGDPAGWDRATEALRRALDESAIPYVVAEGEGAFYAPKIDVHVKDAIGRRWQLSTLQVDLQLPERFDLEYVTPENTRARPCVIHRALFGSIERFFGILVEHYVGAFPTWLAPVQVVVLPVADRHHAYAARVADRLQAEGYRVELHDAHSDTLGARVRRAKTEKVPYVLVVGDEDAETGTVGVNRRGSDAPERGVSVDDFAERLGAEVLSRASGTGG